MSVVVVGDGPSGEGTGWGSFIDEQSAVVRLWNHHWQPPADYGRRYDYGLITAPRNAQNAARNPARKWWYYDVYSKTNGTYNRLHGLDVDVLPHKQWLSELEQLGAKSENGKPLKLARGFAAALATACLLKPQRMFMIGMDMLRDGVTTSPRYGTAATSYRNATMPGHALELVDAGLEREGPHDYTAERALFDAKAAEHGIEIQWGF